MPVRAPRHIGRANERGQCILWSQCATMPPMVSYNTSWLTSMATQPRRRTLSSMRRALRNIRSRCAFLEPPWSRSRLLWHACEEREEANKGTVSEAAHGKSCSALSFRFLSHRNVGDSREAFEDPKTREGTCRLPIHPQHHLVESMAQALGSGSVWALGPLVSGQLMGC